MYNLISTLSVLEDLDFEPITTNHYVDAGGIHEDLVITLSMQQLAEVLNHVTSPLQVELNLARKIHRMLANDHIYMSSYNDEINDCGVCLGCCKAASTPMSEPTKEAIEEARPLHRRATDGVILNAPEGSTLESISNEVYRRMALELATIRTQATNVAAQYPIAARLRDELDFHKQFCRRDSESTQKPSPPEQTK